MNIPAIEVFEKHGLYDIEVDVEVQVSVAQSAAGWATFQPTVEHPLLGGLGNDYTGQRVKFYWCSTEDPKAVRKFRRRCQLWVVDHMSREGESEGSTSRRNKALAWWEDSGLWLIADEPKRNSESLGRWWTKRLDGVRSLDDNQTQNAGTGMALREPAAHGQMYAELCDLFVSMIRCSQVTLLRNSLNQRTFALILHSVYMEATWYRLRRPSTCSA